MSDAREVKAAYMRGWRASNLERARELSREGNARYRAKHVEVKRTNAIKSNERARAFIISFFGGCCVRCGYSDPRALQLDHVNGDGYKDRKSKRDNLRVRFHSCRDEPDLAREKYQLLCANCNSIKRVECQEYANRHTRHLRLDE